MPPTPAPKLPIISVPTTMGCAEFSRGGGGITDHRLGRKLIIAGGESVTHRTVIIDGQALATTPLRILVSTAIGQLRIAIETVYATGHNPIGDGMALHAIRLLFDNLPRCQDGDIDVLLNTKTACAMASLASFGGLGLNTATCHHIGGAVRGAAWGSQRHTAAAHDAVQPGRLRRPAASDCGGDWRGGRRDER